MYLNFIASEPYGFFNAKSFPNYSIRIHTCTCIYVCIIYIMMFVVGRHLPFIERCPSRIPFSMSQPLVSQLHIYRNTTPLLKQLQAQLVTLSKTGQVDEALKTVHTVKQLKYPLHSNIICQLLNFATK